MALSDGVVQRRLPGRVGRIDGAAVLNQQVDHGHRADGGRAVQGVLPALVAHAGRSRRGVALEQLAGEIQVVFGGEEVERCMSNEEIDVLVSK